MREIKWENRALSELGNVSRGKSKHRPRNDKKLYGGDFPFIQTGDVKNANFYINEYSQTYNEIGLKQSKLWKKDTLCVTIAANIAETALLSFPACFPDSIVGFIPFENVSDVRYMKYTLDNYKTEFQKRSKGATQDNLSVSKINSLKLLVPQYDYQVEVADIISKYDLLIENNQKRIDLLEEMSQRLYKEWFIDFKFPDYKKVKMIDSKTERGLIPSGWEVRKLDEFIEIIRGASYSSDDINDFEGKYYLVNLKSFRRNGGFRFEGEKYFNGSIHTNQELNTGDIIVAITDMTTDRAVIARPAIIPKIRTNKITFSADVVKVVSRTLKRNYLFNLLYSHDFTERTKAKANGANVLHLKPDAIKEYVFVKPEISIIDKFESSINTFTEEINNLLFRNQSLVWTRSLLVENLITGRRLLANDN